MTDNFAVPIDPIEPPKKKNTTLIIIVVVALVLVCCCCTALGLLWQYGDVILNSLGVTY